MNKLLRLTCNSRVTSLVAAVFALGSPATAATFSFEASSSGTGVGDGGFPITQAHFEHTTVSATPFPFLLMTADETLNLLEVPISSVVSFTFTDVAGDALFGTYEAEFFPGANPAQFLGSGTFLFTGGTGPFAGASGDGTLSAVVDFTGPTTADSAIEWHGTLQVVPEPASSGLAVGAVLGLLACWRCRRRAR